MSRPPRSFLKFFRWFCLPKVLKYIEGDVMELKSGKRKADLRFIIDVLLLFRPGGHSAYYPPRLLLRTKSFQDFLCQGFFDFSMPRHSLRDSILRIDPDSMTSSLSFEKTPCNAKLAFQIPAFQPTRIFSVIASSGRPRIISPRRSSSINFTASIKFALASSTVSPWPLAPGTSGQMAQYPPSGAGSMMAVNSAFIQLK